ncbi:hypothetical protein BT67DRAFT_455856 [Trichocladium antarcticum]|uniref:Uncharacterized protein n=1 Tax=Trichocladium antarcticum TaxID=1450529 RepID=A0AAN6UK45_9PEZI|nr:hypothetical protein BT67DRAFT_455856 [Trichocladium antarcticum]
MSSSYQTAANGKAAHWGPSRTQIQWREGDIAFLLPAGQYSPSDRLALLKGHGKGHLDEKATGHPIIILCRLSEKSDHVLATTVSAYSSGPGNNFLAPWKQTYHRSKNPLDFLSFEGSERVNNKIPALHLEGGSWAKPKTSWVYSQSIFVVPVSVLCRYNKACGKQLRVRPDSLDFLRRHMEQRCRTWAIRQRDLRAAEQGAPPAQFASASSWRAPSQTTLPPPPNPPAPAAPPTWLGAAGAGPAQSKSWASIAAK